MILICENCNESFISLNYKKCCSRSCNSKLPWKDPKYKQKMSEIRKEYMNRPEVKQKNSETQKRVQSTPEARKRNSNAQKIAQNRPDVKAKFQEQMKTYWSKEEHREKQSIRQSEYTNRPEVKEKIGKKSIEVNSRPDVKELQSKSTIEQWKNVDFYQNMCRKHKEYMNRPDVKERCAKQMSIRATNMWKRPDFAENHMQKCFKYKEYVMPSGKIVKIQGYEPLVLNELLKTYLESDIVIGVKSMNKEIGHIKYIYENIERTYYPDFYIKSTNTIIEVKSQWTYKIHEEKNLAKKQACINQGFNFEFKIL